MSVLYSSNDSSYYTEVCQGEWLQLLTITKLGLSNEKEDWSWVWNLRVSIFFTKYEDRFQFFYYWEYKLVRSVFLCIYFKTKWMNSSSQLKYCLSLPTTFSHLSGNFRIPSRKNDSFLEAIQFCSQFSISAKEVNRWFAAFFGTTSNQKEQCPENTASAVKHPIWAFPNIFLRF